MHTLTSSAPESAQIITLISNTAEVVVSLYGLKVSGKADIPRLVLVPYLLLTHMLTLDIRDHFCFAFKSVVNMQFE